VALAVVPPQPLLDHRLELEKGAFVELPPMPSFRTGVFRHAECVRAIREVEARSDVVIVQLPFPAPSALLMPKKPRVYHLCADVLSILRGSSHYQGATRVLALSTAFAVEHYYRALFSSGGARVVTNGQDLLDRYRPPRGCAVVSSSILDSEIGSVARQRTDDAFRISFVGHLRPEKGFDVLLDAFERVRRELPRAELEVIGPTIEHQRFVADALSARVSSLASVGAVRSLGPKPFGVELFRCFADADVLALPSVSEGTPRVLIEARAFGCPVVASRVGGIPTSVADGVDGLLVPPRDPAALAAALVRLAREPELRKRLVEGGFARARRSTVDRFAHAILAEAEAALGATNAGWRVDPNT
jgi:glycosyltransferase involved in cell wall biosynthesis